MAYYELVIDTLLSNFDVELASSESMIVPEFPDPRRILGLIAVGSLAIAEVGTAE